MRLPSWLIAAYIALSAFSAQATMVCATSTPGSGNITGAVNDYWAGSGSPGAGATSITLGARRAGGAGNNIAPGDLVLIIQMQDADINSNNSSAYGSGGTSGAGSTAVNSAGLYEFVVATNAVGAGGGTLTFSAPLVNSYRTRAFVAGSHGQSTWQAIRVPRYASVTATNVTAPAWDGTTGGVVALDVIGQLTLGGTTAIDVAGRGFRGGAGRSLGGASGLSNTDWVRPVVNAHASKGEGIAGTPRYVNRAGGVYNGAPQLVDTLVEGYPNGSYARGAPGNAGGGGTDGLPSNNSHNTGGGGGGNYNAGGQGGNSWSTNLPVGGRGGAAYDGTLDFHRVFMGGGGGAGTTNNGSSHGSTYSSPPPPGLACTSAQGLCSSGAAGGGIVIVRAGSVTGSGEINARGSNAYNVGQDGAGGGGAGGSVVLQTYSGGSATVNAAGGNGGNAWRSRTASSDRHGPGGGGGGGFIAYSPSSLSVSANVSGGLAGLSAGNDVYGATAGGGGISTSDTPYVPGAQAGAFCPPAIKAVRLFTDGAPTGQVDPGDVVEYTVIYRNGSHNPITGFNMTDSLPSGLSYVPGSLAVTASGGASASANGSYNGTTNINLLAAPTTLTTGGIIQATFRAQVSVTPATCGYIFNQANSVQDTGQVVIGPTDNADNDQNSNGLPAGTYISQAPFGTTGATDPTGINVVCPAITGRVYEDINYGGGSGRSFAASSGAPVAGARVELYNSVGSYLSFTTTDASGFYRFYGLASGSYTVRVVNGSVRSTRAGGAACTGCLPVQTWRSDASSGTAVAVTDRVGGENPALVDAGNGSTTLAALTTSTTTPQSITSVAYSVTPIFGVDFGYNFDTIVNVNNAGQGSLQQFITNANSLGDDASLAQAGYRTDLVTGSAVPLASGVEQSIFMITDGTARPGLRAGLASQLTDGRALIALSTALPSITSTLRIEGGTQTYNVGNTNNVTLGTGGTVGVGAAALPQLNGPEVELRDGPTGAGGFAIGLDVQAANTVIRGLAIVGFGNTVASNTNGNIRIGNVTGVTINQNVLGATALSFTDPAGSLRGTGDNLRINNGDSGTISQNLIGFSSGNGIGFGNSTDGWVIERNEIRGNGVANAARNGIELPTNAAATPNAIRFNLIAANNGAGIHLSSDLADNNTITQNTITGNGNLTEPGGIRVSSGDSNTISLNIIHANNGPGIELMDNSQGNTVSQNIIHSNTQSGIEVDNGATGNTLTQNSIYGNTRIGIDLLTAAQGATPVSPYYTQNDNGDGDAGGNNVQNFPQLSSATVFGNTVTVSGIAPAGAIIEFFIADNDATGFGEGQTYLATRTEGSSDDSAGGTGTSTVTCGTGAVPVTMNNFTFTFTSPVPIPSGALITTTATVGGNTSEFSCNVPVLLIAPNLLFMKSQTTHSDPVNGTSGTRFNIPGAEIDYTLRVSNPGNVGVDNNSIVIIDPIPANTELFTGNLSGGAPFAFTDGTPSSGVTCGFIALHNFTDCVDFSVDGTNWTAVPSGGYDPTITHIRFNPSGAMNADAVPGPPHPYFELRFRVRVK